MFIPKASSWTNIPGKCLALFSEAIQPIEEPASCLPPCHRAHITHAFHLKYFAHFVTLGKFFFFFFFFHFSALNCLHLSPLNVNTVASPADALFLVCFKTLPALYVFGCFIVDRCFLPMFLLHRGNQSPAFHLHVHLQGLAFTCVGPPEAFCHAGFKLDAGPRAAISIDNVEPRERSGRG